MSWAAHELESYFLQKHTKIRVSYLAILLGCLAPDFTKFHVYGLDIGPIHLKAAKHPYEYHRGWPGVGPTHSLMFGVFLFVFVLLVFRSKQWALGLLIGQWAHVLTDICDSVGTMVFFPFSTQHYTIGMWAYAAQQGKYGDAAAYYSSLGGVWDFFWLLMVLTGFQVLTRRLLLRPRGAQRPGVGVAAPSLPPARRHPAGDVPRLLPVRRLPHHRVVHLVAHCPARTARLVVGRPVLGRQGGAARTSRGARSSGTPAAAWCCSRLASTCAGCCSAAGSGNRGNDLPDLLTT